MTHSEMEKLFEQNRKLAHSIVWRHYPLFSQSEDVHQEALIGLWRACMTFNEDKGKFQTYAYTCILNQIRMSLRKQAKQVPVLSLDVPLGTEDGMTFGDMVEDPVPCIDESLIDLKDYLNSLPIRDQEIILYKLQGLYQSQIAKRMGLTQSWCSRVLHKIHADYIKRRGEDG